MDIEKILELFTLFSGETDSDKYLAYIESSMCYVEKQLVKAEYKTDSRLPFYVASLANLSYTRAFLMRNRTAQTYAGTIAEIPSEKSLLQDDFAMRLCDGYRALCSDILKDDTFYFLLSGKEDIQED